MIDNDEQKWKARLAFVDMFFEIKHQEDGFVSGYICRNGGGLCSQGIGATVGEAISNASNGQNIDWWSIEKKITEQEWSKIAHE